MCPSPKNISKICDFCFFSFGLCTDIILKQLNKIKNLFFSLFIFLCCFPFCFPRCASLLWSPLYYPVALPRCWVEVLAPTVEKIDDLGHVPIFKKIVLKKICDFHFFLRILYRHYYKAIKFKKIQIFFCFFTFIFLCCFSCFFSRCASLLWSLLSYPVVHPTAAPQELQRQPGTARFHFPPTHARWRKTLTPDSLHWDHRPGETPRGDTTWKQNRKFISINVKSI